MSPGRPWGLVPTMTLSPEPRQCPLTVCTWELGLQGPLQKGALWTEQGQAQWEHSRLGAGYLGGPWGRELVLLPLVHGLGQTSSFLGLSFLSFQMES